jgi:hypothetical protein
LKLNFVCTTSRNVVQIPLSLTYQPLLTCCSDLSIIDHLVFLFLTKCLVLLILPTFILPHCKTPCSRTWISWRGNYDPSSRTQNSLAQCHTSCLFNESERTENLPLEVFSRLGLVRLSKSTVHYYESWVAATCRLVEVFTKCCVSLIIRDSYLRKVGIHGSLHSSNKINKKLFI